MSRRAADARDVFELHEACRFGGDMDRLKAILHQCRFDLNDSKSALIVLQSGRSPTAHDDVTAACEKMLKRRIVSAESRQRRRRESAPPRESH